MRSRLASSCRGRSLVSCTLNADTAPRNTASPLPGYRYEFPRDHFDHPDFPDGVVVLHRQCKSQRMGIVSDSS